MEIIEAYEHRYEFAVLDELPGNNGDIYYFPGASTIGGHSGCMVKFYPVGRLPWIGIFALGTIATKGKYAIYTMPCDHCICIVCRGKGYIVDVECPTNITYISVEPIYNIKYIFAKRLLLFVSPWEIVAYGENGQAWRTERISFEGFNIIKVSEERITVATEEVVSIVDTNTGIIVHE